MKILVTGVTGYIGSHTAIELLKRDEVEVVGVDNLMNSQKATLDRIHQITGKHVKFYEVDLCDKNSTSSVFEKEGKIDGIIHFAALKAVGESVEKPLLYYRNNLDSLINILEASKKHGTDNFIFSSSCSLYGNVSRLPVNEETALSKTESPYAHTKLVGEEILRATIKIQDIKVCSLRYFNPVGAHESGLNGELPISKPNNLVPIITQTAIGKMDKMFVHGNDYDTRDGSCIRDYIHVTDIANAHLLALDHLIQGKNNSKFEVFNLGTGNGVTVLEAIRAFEKVSGVQLNYEMGPRREGDVAAIYSDSSKALKELGWKPKYSLEEMMESAWKWEQNLEAT